MNIEGLPLDCRQRLKALGRMYPRSNCQVCGELAPNASACDRVIKAHGTEAAPVKDLKMTADQYRAALAELGLTQLAAGRWLGVSPKTAQNYANTGPSGPAARAIQMLMDMDDASRAAALNRDLK